MTGELRRRTVLQGLAGGAALIAGVGTVGAIPGAVPDRYIVGTSSPAAVRAARRAASSVHREFDFGDIGGAVVGRFPGQALAALEQRSDVRYVERDGEVRAIHHRDNHSGGPGNDDGGGGDDGSGGDTESLPWGVDRVDAELAHGGGATGSGIRVAIIDTGIDADHPDLQANLGEGYAVESCRGGTCRIAWDDDNGHGTHCAGTVAAVDNTQGVIGVAPGSTLHAVKVLDKRGSGTFSGVIDGILWVADKDDQYHSDYDIQIGSMSLGASSGSNALRDACQTAANAGVLLVAASGNDGSTDSVSYPAAYDTVMAISATDDTDTVTSWSNTGPNLIDLAAPGASITSTVPGGGYDTMSGTSMACPHVSGGAAVAWAYLSSPTNTSVRDHLLASAEDLASVSADEEGSGLLDVATAVGLDSSDNLATAA